MEKSENTKKFEKINELYSQYSKLAALKDNKYFDAMYGNLSKSLRDKIFIEICEFYFDFETPDENKEFDSVDDDNKYSDNFSEVVVEEINTALEKYEESTSKKNGYSFSVHVCRNIKQALGKAKSNYYASVNNGGSCITDYEAKTIRDVLREDKELEDDGFYDENERNRILAVNYGKSVDKIIEYKQLAKAKTTPNERQNAEGDTYFLSDIDVSVVEKNSASPETELLQKELKEKLRKLLEEINELYKKKSNPRDSEIIAVKLLESFEETKKATKVFSPEIYELLQKYECVDKTILNSFFEEEEYILPTLQKIADKYNLDKSAPSKIWERYAEKLSLNKNVTDYFEEHIK